MQAIRCSVDVRVTVPIRKPVVTYILAWQQKHGRSTAGARPVELYLAIRIGAVTASNLVPKVDEWMLRLINTDLGEEAESGPFPLERIGY